MSKLGEFLTIKHGWAFKGEFFSETGTQSILTPGNFYEKGGFKYNNEKERYYTGDYPPEYLCKKGLWLSICDEIDDPNKNDAINQLEILSRRGYFSIPTYNFEQTYDKDGNPIWKSICSIAEKSKSFSAESSSKKDAKKSAAFKMLQYVLRD